METLLIPLYCRALETRKEAPIIVDTKAVELMKQVEYDFSTIKINSGTYLTTCMRAKRFDYYATHFLAQHPGGIIISLGSGLDSRFDRVDNGSVTWYDLDFPEVIDLRKKFYKESDRYHLVPSPVTALEWINCITHKGNPVLVIAEGLFMYLKEVDVKRLILTLRESFPHSTLVFDCFSELTARRIKNHPSIKKMKAQVHWGLDDPHVIETWHKGITFQEEWFFTQSEDIRKMKLGYRIMFAIAGLFSVAKKAHRLSKYQLSG